MGIPVQSILSVMTSPSLRLFNSVKLYLLCSYFVQGGCVDHMCQVIPVLYMALGQKDVSKLRIGQLTDYT